jgi:hypothetical protein
MRGKARGFLVTLAVAVFLGASANGAGLVSLFDGKSLDGWVAVATDHFVVRNGVIANDGGTGWLRGARLYKDFELHADYRVVRPGSDSGLFFRASAESTPRPPNWPVRGYQLQVIDGEGQLMLFGHGTPVKFDRKGDALKAVMKGPGEWQTLVLKVVGSRAEVSLNGTLITVSNEISLSEGHIGLQGKNGQFEWRALSIKELPPH